MTLRPLSAPPSSRRQPGLPCSRSSERSRKLNCNRRLEAPPGHTGADGRRQLRAVQVRDGVTIGDGTVPSYGVLRVQNAGATMEGRSQHSIEAPALWRTLNNGVT